MAEIRAYEVEEGDKLVLPVGSVIHEGGYVDILVRMPGGTFRSVRVPEETTVRVDG